MSVETKITITCNRCGKKSTPDNYKKFCSKVNLPSHEHYNSFGISLGRNTGVGINWFKIDIDIDGRIDLCPECRRWAGQFFEDQADNIKKLLRKEW